MFDLNIDYLGVLHHPVSQQWWEIHYSIRSHCEQILIKKVDFVSALKWVCHKKRLGLMIYLQANVTTPNQQGFYQNSAGIPIVIAVPRYPCSSPARVHTVNEDSWGQLH